MNKKIFLGVSLFLAFQACKKEVGDKSTDLKTLGASKGVDSQSYAELLERQRKLQSELDAIKEQEKNRENLERENQHLKDQNEATRRYLEELDKKIQTLQSDLNANKTLDDRTRSDLNQMIDDLRTQQETMNVVLTGRAEELERLSNEHHQKLEALYSELSAQKAILSAEQEALRKELGRQLEQYNKDKSQNEKELQELRDRVARVESWEERIKALEVYKDTSSERITDLERRVGELEGDRDQLKSENKDILEKLAQYKKELAELKKIDEEFATTQKKLEDKVADLKAQLEENKAYIGKLVVESTRFYDRQVQLLSDVMENRRKRQSETDSAVISSLDREYSELMQKYRNEIMRDYVNSLGGVAVEASDNGYPTSIRVPLEETFILITPPYIPASSEGIYTGISVSLNLQNYADQIQAEYDLFKQNYENMKDYVDNFIRLYEEKYDSQKKDIQFIGQLYSDLASKMNEQSVDFEKLRSELDRIRSEDLRDVETYLSDAIADLSRKYNELYETFQTYLSQNNITNP